MRNYYLKTKTWADAKGMLYEIKPMPTSNLELNKKLTKVPFDANNIINAVPTVGIKVYKLGTGV